ncbi:MAG: hypothetical protein PHG06_10710 [Parabacteroides sp.]|nr:hypothetical protein [Parabacteroides sp.]
MKRLIAPILIIFVIALQFVSCEGLDENYATNPNLKLSFSADTLSFDTVFTDIGSATHSFMIYNHNDKPLLISNILLASGGESGFRINVDGRKGNSFNDIRIGANDSLYVLAEVTVNPNKENGPLLVSDSVLFNVNGIKQVVRLEAYGQDVNLLKGGITLLHDTTFNAEKPYLIYDSLVIAQGATLHIAPGSVFYMHNKANIINYGTIVANGSLESPIIIRGDRLDFILNDVLPYDRTPSQWGGIYFRKESFNNEMNYMIVRNGNTGLTFEPSSTEQPKLKMHNSQITNMGKNLLSAFNCHIEIDNSELSNAGEGVANLIGGKYSFIHCTIVNYMALTPRNGSYPCLTISNNANNQTFPLEATFANCVIDGSFSSGKTDFQGEMLLSINESTTFNYLFNHCVIKSKGSANEHYTDVIFTDVSPSYRLTGGEKNKYCFDFRPDSATTIGVGKADLAISKSYPTDRYGVNRLTNNTPSIGAYEFVEQKK